MIKITKGEKSLDLLQGLLVFMAWHHRYMDADAPSLNLLLQICLGQAVDLGLDRLCPAPVDDPWQGRESRRAYLGCYYLARCLDGTAANRIQGLSFDNTMSEFALDLGRTGDAITDQLIVALIELCHLLEDIDETCRTQFEHALSLRSQLRRLQERSDSLLRSTRHLQEYSESSWVWVHPLKILTEHRDVAVVAVGGQGAFVQTCSLHRSTFQA